MILEMRDICKDYPMGKSVAHILKNVNLDVEEGEYLAIMGPSGSGKTTLMNLIGCLDVPTSGSYLLGGRDVTTCNNKQLAEVRNKELGFVFQSFNLLPKLTALENVALPLLYGGVKKAERLERARAALETVGLSDRVEHRPDQLSGGQCQRVAIARAIVGKPKLLLADEPTGALDSHTGREVLGMLQQMHDEGHTVVLITHHMNEAEHADRVIVMNEGRVAMDGAPREVFAQVEKLKSIGLTVPDTVELLYELRGAGCDLPLTAITVDECADAIARCFGKSAKEDN